MKPLWHLSIVASSVVMLNKSTEDTLYNMAQVANITQLVGHPLRFHSSVTVTKCMLLSRYSESHSVGLDFFKKINIYIYIDTH